MKTSKIIKYKGEGNNKLLIFFEIFKSSIDFILFMTVLQITEKFFIIISS